MDTPTPNPQPLTPTPQPPIPRLRVVIYARTGPDDGWPHEPIEAQLAACRGYAWRHGYLVVREVVEPDMSDTTLDRPGLAVIRQLMAAGEVDAIVAASLDRLVIDHIHRLVLWAECALADVELISVKRRQHGDIDSTLVLGGIDAAFKIHRQFISSRQRPQSRSTAHRAPSTTGEPPSSYRYVDRIGWPAHEISAAQADLVCQIVALALGLDGGGTRRPEKIREQLVAEMGRMTADR